MCSSAGPATSSKSRAACSSSESIATASVASASEEKQGCDESSGVTKGAVGRKCDLKRARHSVARRFIVTHDLLSQQRLPTRGVTVAVLPVLLRKTGNFFWR